MNERSEGTKVSPIVLGDSLISSLKIAKMALVQARTALEILGFDRTRQSVTDVIEDLHKAVAHLADHKLNARQSTPQRKDEL